MTFSTARRYSCDGRDLASSSANGRLQCMAGAALVSLVFAYAFVAWTNVGTNLAANDADVDRAAPALPAGLAAVGARAAMVERAYSELAAGLKHAALRSAFVATNYAALFDSRAMGFPSGTFLQRIALHLEDETTLLLRGQGQTERTQQFASVPPSAEPAPHETAAPTKPPSLLRRVSTSIRDRIQAVREAATKQTEQPTIFERLFGKPSTLTLAYANPDDGINVSRIIAGRYDSATAVYDISAHTVYLPDGTALEAHSGRGALLDNPLRTNERMRGATPVNMYDLELRERPFHGVQALRLVPVDEDKVFGRRGLLAHTYMLGPHGESFGCVSFKDYAAFLRAYNSGEIKRLAVVSRVE
jgi:Protein of unknown function (DUF2778)